MKVGDRFDFEEEAIHGIIADVMEDEHGEVLAIVVALDDGRFASVDMTGLESQSHTLH